MENLKEISKTRAALLGTLSSKKMRQKHRLFLAEGSKCVEDTLGAFELVNIVATTDWIEQHNNMIEEKAKILTAGSETLRKISSLSTPPDVIAVFRLPEEVAEGFHLEKEELYLLLDGIQDPGNLGTIIRTADWFGFNKVICSKDTVDVYNPKTVQATMGALRRVKVIYSDLGILLKDGKVRNVYGTLLEGENIFQKKLKNEGVIIMGNEGKGISERIRKYITEPLLIPPTRKEAHGESLNVAIATGITLAQFRK